MKEFDEYRAAARAYTAVVTPGEDDDYVARAIDFPAAVGPGDTPKEALEALFEGIAAGLEDADEQGYPAPQPMRPSGNATSVRLPRSLYRVLAARAEAEGLSLNATIVYLLAQCLAVENQVPKPRRRRAKPKQEEATEQEAATV